MSVYVIQDKSVSKEQPRKLQFSRFYDIRIFKISRFSKFCDFKFEFSRYQDFHDFHDSHDYISHREILKFLKILKTLKILTPELKSWKFVDLEILKIWGKRNRVAVQTKTKIGIFNNM